MEPRPPAPHKRALPPRPRDGQGYRLTVLRKASGEDGTNGGLSSKYASLVCTRVVSLYPDGEVAVQPIAPELRLREPGDVHGAEVWAVVVYDDDEGVSAANTYFVPAAGADPDDASQAGAMARRYMFGGNYAEAPEPARWRVGVHGLLPTVTRIHDRYEER